MIYTLADLFFLDTALLLVFLIFCLCDFKNNCKFKLDIIMSSNLALYHYQISSPDSPDKKRPSFLSHA